VAELVDEDQHAEHEQEREQGLQYRASHHREIREIGRSGRKQQGGRRDPEETNPSPISLISL
jgi:hypothetical protein